MQFRREGRGVQQGQRGCGMQRHLDGRLLGLLGVSRGGSCRGLLLPLSCLGLQSLLLLLHISCQVTLLLSNALTQVIPATTSELHFHSCMLWSSVVGRQGCNGRLYACLQLGTVWLWLCALVDNAHDIVWVQQRHGGC